MQGEVCVCEGGGVCTNFNGKSALVDGSEEEGEHGL